MADLDQLGTPRSGNRTILIVCSYLWILALVPLLVEKDDAEVQWHARHGIVLLVAELAFWILFNVIAGAAMGIGCLGCLAGPLIGLGFVVLHGAAMVRGIQGGRLIVPFISRFAERG